MTIESSAWNADQRQHHHRRDFVFPDGVRLGDVLDAIAAAGSAGNYVLANELKIRYALDVCTRCASRLGQVRVSLLDFGIDAFGMICSVCELGFLASGRQKRRL